MRTLYALIACCFLSAMPTAHAEEAASPPLPAAVFKGSVHGFLGHEGGYIPPKIGDTIEIDFRTVNGLSDSLLKFQGRGYVPLPGTLHVQSVEGGETFETWGSFIATAASGQSTLILNAQRKAGYGDKDFVVIWILVKRNENIMGALELRGKIYPPE